MIRNCLVSEQPGSERTAGPRYSLTGPPLRRTGDFTVARFHDPDEAVAFGLEVSLALGEFLELRSRPVLDLDTAMPAILASMERIKT